MPKQDPKRPHEPESSDGDAQDGPSPRKGALTRPLVRYPVASQPRPPVVVSPPPDQTSPLVDPEVSELPIAIDPRNLQQGIKRIGEELQHWVKKGKYTKVRVKLGKKQLLPDIPITVALAAEGLAFALLGPLQAVLGNVVGQTVLNVELISDAAHHVNRGRELILAGELEAALEQFRTAVAIDRDHAPAYLHIGIALKLQGDKQGARISFEKASALDPQGAAGLEAEKLLATLRG